jgi:alkanesulfonate monooxygenase SsuD/methylene tetrahydromethanopterin reductase-like flavin-dependent oxidoreductase (luciferase family)
VELDLIYEISAAEPWPDGQRAIEREKFMNVIDQVKFADELGFRTAWFVEHHFRETRAHCSAPEVVIGALSQVTRRIRLGFGVTLMPHGFTSPVRVAEKVATADILSGGRIDWGSGRSSPAEQAAFGVPAGDLSKKQWADAVRSVAEMWTQDLFSWDSEFFKFTTPRPIIPKPQQLPHPPAWTAAVSEGTALAAGRGGLGLLSLSVLRPVSVLANLIKQYREAAANPVDPMTHVITNRVAAFTLVHCADTEQDAESNGIWDAVWWWYHNLAEINLKWDFPEMTQEQRDLIYPLLKARAEGSFEPRDFAKEDMVVVGDVDEVVSKAKRYADAGVDQLMCYCAFGNLSHEAIMRNIELLGREVLPQIKDYVPNPDTFGGDEEISEQALLTERTLTTQHQQLL